MNDWRNRLFHDTLSSLVGEIMEEFIAVTKDLKENLLEDLFYKYTEGRKFNRKDYDDFAIVKKESYPLFDQIEKWETEAQAIVHKLPIFPNQITNTKDNLEIMILHSYFHDVRRKRFMELYHSVLYNFDLVLDQFDAQ